MISELAREGLGRCTDKGQKMNDTQHRYPIETDTKGKANMEDGEQDKKKHGNNSSSVVIVINSQHVPRFFY